jgi:DNA-binding protein
MGNSISKAVTVYHEEWYQQRIVKDIMGISISKAVTVYHIYHAATMELID